MALALTVTKITIVSRRGRNGMPGSGDVTFSDGKSYGWSFDNVNNIFFSSYRKRHATTEMFIFNSAKRAKLVEDYLNNKHVETTVIHVSR